MNWLQQSIAIMTMALGIVPQVLEIIKAAEVPGHGTDKFKLVTGIVSAALGLLPESAKNAIGENKIMAFMEKVVNMLVSFLNITGQFKKSPPDPQN
jgi:hypothetical protein